MDVEDSKACSKCTEEKFLSQFSIVTRGAKRVPDSWCKSCKAGAADAWNRANPERHRAIALASGARHGYGRRLRQSARDLGLDPQAMTLFYAQHDGRCDICGKLPEGRDRRLHIDHDHATGDFRGLLCRRCNTALGQLEDDVERFRSAIRYLEKTPEARFIRVVPDEEGFTDGP